MNSAPVSSRFRFRFVTRGEPANTLVKLAMSSLYHCHPGVGIVLVDANDTPFFNQPPLGANTGPAVVHIPPGEDPIADVFGRGSRRHLYYWRHSPHVLEALPKSEAFDVHADVDILFIRPLNLGSLVPLLARGRIAATVDESSLEYHAKLGTLAAAPTARFLVTGDSGTGPLLQGGLLITNPAADGGFYPLFWQSAVTAARSGGLEPLEWDDMCIVTALLGEGGPLWERLLILGHEWNYITDARKDPGIFGRAAHYGGRRAQSLLLARQELLLSTPPGNGLPDWWGTVVGREGTEEPAPIRGPWRRRATTGQPAGDGLPPLSVPLPFALSRAVSGAVAFLDICATMFGPDPTEFFLLAGPCLYIYIDGQPVDCPSFSQGYLFVTVPASGAESVTVIGICGVAGCYVHLAIDEILA